MDFKIRQFLFCLAVLIFFNCGSKPEIRVRPQQSAEDLWQTFTARYDSIQTLALSGTFVIKGEKTYECKLQLVYASPDSFAFLAEGTLGIDAARGALINGAGFWEIPREKYSEEISRNDLIEFDGHQFDLDIFLQAIFFFRNMIGFKFDSNHGYRYQYVSESSAASRVLVLNSDSGTPIRQIIARHDNGTDDIYEIDYFAWRTIGESMIIPGRITYLSKNKGLQAEYQIEKLKINRSIPAALFTPKL